MPICATWPVYFASQTPTAGTLIPAPAATADKGEALYLAGRSCARDSSLPRMPWRRCEGHLDRQRSIRGVSVAARAVLDVFVARLTSFHKNQPHDTTNDFIMGGVAQTLDEESIQAIAAWLSSLTPERSL